METYYKNERELKLLTTANIIAGSISQNNFLSDEAKRQMLEGEINIKSKENSIRILVLDTKGIVINDSSKTEIGKTYVTPEMVEGLQKNSKISAKGDILYVSVSIFNKDSQKIGVVLIVASLKDIYSALDKIEKILLLFIVLTVILLVFLSFIGSKFLLDPLNNVLKVVQKMSDGHLNQRITVKGKDEFSELGIAFNNMTQKLEQVEKTREEFVSNVSHELKTPLSSIKVLTESILLEQTVPIEMYREFLQDINSEIDRMTNIVNDLLNLVKLDQREIGLNIRETDISEVVFDILKRLNPLAEQKNIELIFEEIKTIVVEADEVKLSLAISNLIENGIKYTPEGGTVRIILDCDHQNAFITVQDTGIGINEEHQAKVFNRFYRVDKTRDRETGGTGLGLSITHSTILLHNGSIRLTSKENEGSIFLVRLPIHYQK